MKIYFVVVKISMYLFLNEFYLFYGIFRINSIQYILTKTVIFLKIISIETYKNMYRYGRNKLRLSIVDTSYG